jgi:predicted transcriptional regulator
MRTITVKLPPPLGERLSRAVVRRRSTRSAVVREAIEAYLAAEPSRREGSCHDLASDLAGSVSGPVDLSSSRLRMRGYGR